MNYFNDNSPVKKYHFVCFGGAGIVGCEFLSYCAAEQKVKIMDKIKLFLNQARRVSKRSSSSKPLLRPAFPPQTRKKK